MKVPNIFHLIAAVICTWAAVTSYEPGSALFSGMQAGFAVGNALLFITNTTTEPKP